MIDFTRLFRLFVEKMRGIPFGLSLGILSIILLMIIFLLYRTYLQEDEFEERIEEDEE